MLFIPVVPILFGHIYFAYEKNDSKICINNSFQHPYICYNNSRYDHYFATSSKVLFNNATCYRHKYGLISTSGEQVLDEHYLHSIYSALEIYNQDFNYSSTFCNRTSMYQCINSSICIPIDRQNDFMPDCPLGDDEYRTKLHHNNTTEEEGGITCETCTDADHVIQRYVRKTISFQTICDGYTEQVTLVWRLTQLFLVVIVFFNYQKTIYLYISKKLTSDSNSPPSITLI